MCKRLCDFLQFHNILYEFQFGFRKHHPTVLAIMEVIDNIGGAEIAGVENAGVDNDGESCRGGLCRSGH